MAVQELGEAWTGGTLAKEFPDQIHRRRSERDDEIRLKRHVYPVVGAVRVRDLTVEECEQVMRSLAPTLAVNTRRNVGLTLGRILSLAVYPLKIIAASPFPKGLLPSAGKGKGKALADYRPADDATERLEAEGHDFVDALRRSGRGVRDQTTTSWPPLIHRWRDFLLSRPSGGAQLGGVATHKNSGYPRNRSTRELLLRPTQIGALTEGQALGSALE